MNLFEEGSGCVDVSLLGEGPGAVLQVHRRLVPNVGVVAETQQGLGEDINH